MQDITRPLKEGYSFSINSYVKGGWQLMNAQLGTFIGMTFLFFIIQIVLSLIPFVSILNNFISTMMYAGYFIYCRNILLQKNETGDFFKGFNYAGNIILYLLVYLLILSPLLVVFFAYLFPFGAMMDLMSGSMNPNDYSYAMVEHFQDIGVGMILMGLLMMVVGVYLAISYLFAIPLIVDANLGFWQAMELSRKVVGKKFFNFFFSLLLGGILMTLAIILTCGLGVLFVFPLYYCILFSAYDQVFEPYANEMKNDLESFGELEKDINSESQEERES